VWISFIELHDAFAGRSEASFRNNFAAMMENCKSVGINTVYVHLRSHGDAFYKSELFPWAKSITGTVGGDPGFDPLKIMLEEAHKRNISFHGWLNPMRLQPPADISSVSSSYAVGRWFNNRNGTYIIRVGDINYLNPAYSDVRKLIADGVSEIVKNYNVDGIHIDDYFYPPSCPVSFDSAAFSASSFTDRTAFRIDNCSRMVKAMHDAVKAQNSAVQFGISPQGSIKNCYDIFADVNRWASTAGFCDYIAPQLYYGFLNATEPFDRCLSDWEALVKGTNIKLIPGLAIYKIGLEDQWAGTAGRREWITSDDIIKRQVDLTKKATNYGGYIMFSYRHIFTPGANTPAINAQLAKAGIK